jgi:signal-transduction protein with cAMP-binding, CBS, and nucleotidyltransferase domain
MVLFAKDVLEPDFLSLPRGVTALDAAKIMKEKHQDYIVVSVDGKPEGIVTEWDYLTKIVAEGIDPARLKLEQIMTAGLITVQASDGLDVVAKVMTEKSVRRVVVVKDGTVLGVITSRTILARLEDYVNTVSNTIARLQMPPF